MKRFIDSGKNTHPRDNIQWSDAFINWMMGQNGCSPRAKSWLSFGKSTGIPILNSRKGGGHVCFVGNCDKRIIDKMEIIRK